MDRRVGVDVEEPADRRRELTTVGRVSRSFTRSRRLDVMSSDVDRSGRRGRAFERLKSATRREERDHDAQNFSSTLPKLLELRLPAGLRACCASAALVPARSRASSRRAPSSATTRGCCSARARARAHPPPRWPAQHAYAASSRRRAAAGARGAARGCADGGANRVHDATPRAGAGAGARPRGRPTRPPDVRAAPRPGVAIARAPGQDRHDLDKALAAVLELGAADAAAGGGPRDVIVWGAFGDRFDHVMASVDALFRWADRFDGELALLSRASVATLLPTGRSVIRPARPVEARARARATPPRSAPRRAVAASHVFALFLSPRADAQGPTCGSCRSARASARRGREGTSTSSRSRSASS